MMRTTLTLPSDVYELARATAELKRISLGDAVAELIRQGVRQPAEVDTRPAFPTFAVSSTAPPITLEQTLEAEDLL